MSTLRTTGAARSHDKSEHLNFSFLVRFYLLTLSLPSLPLSISLSLSFSYLVFYIRLSCPLLSRFWLSMLLFYLTFTTHVQSDFLQPMFNVTFIPRVLSYLAIVSSVLSDLSHCVLSDNSPLFYLISYHVFFLNISLVLSDLLPVFYLTILPGILFDLLTCVLSDHFTPFIMTFLRGVLSDNSTRFLPAFPVFYLIFPPVFYLTFSSCFISDPLHCIHSAQCSS